MGLELDGRDLIPGMSKKFFSTVSRPNVDPIQPHVQWVPGLFTRD
jgi:hypothetical protein